MTEGQDGVVVELEPPKSLIEIFEPREYPGKIGLWRVAIQIPEPPEFSGGGLVIPDQYRQDMEFATYIGNVRSMGALCFKSVTSGGVKLSDDPGFKVGDWVQIGKHTGEKFRTTDGTLWVVFSETQYIAVIDQPEMFDCLSL